MPPKPPETGFRELIRRIAARGDAPSPYDGLFGVRIEELSDGLCRLSVPVGPAHHNPAGVVHGGVLSGLADSAMAYALSTRIRPDESITNIDLTIRFLRATVETRLVAKARVMREGRSVVVMECDLENGDGELVARASSSFLRRPAQGGAGWLKSAPP